MFRDEYNQGFIIAGVRVHGTEYYALPSWIRDKTEEEEEVLEYILNKRIESLPETTRPTTLSYSVDVEHGVTLDIVKDN